MASISCRHVKKVYPGNVTAVPDFNLEIADKEFIVFVGPSGCGKSTTLRMIAGLEEISGGEMYIGDRLINDVPPKDRDIAMVFQNYALYPHMTVYKNMAFGLELRKMPKDEIDKRVREAAKILEIEHLLDRKPRLCPVVSVSVLPWAVQWSVTRRSSCSTSLCPTWMLSCVPACVPRSSSCTRSWLPPSSTLPTTRPRL
mgnify:CR=1 FL=1